MNAHEPTERRAEWGFMLVFALLAAGIVMVSYLYYRNYERHYRAEVERQVSHIAIPTGSGRAGFSKSDLGDWGEHPIAYTEFFDLLS